jgi:hypothetical protein
MKNSIHLRRNLFYDASVFYDTAQDVCVGLFEKCSFDDSVFRIVCEVPSDISGKDDDEKPERFDKFLKKSDFSGFFLVKIVTEGVPTKFTLSLHPNRFPLTFQAEQLPLA